MDIREAIRTMKSRIKDLAVEQTKTKRARKTTIPKEESAALCKELGLEHAVWAAARVLTNKGKITAHLNHYHALRGSTHEHEVRTGLDWVYNKTIEALRLDFPIHKVV